MTVPGFSSYHLKLVVVFLLQETVSGFKMSLVPRNLQNTKYEEIMTSVNKYPARSLILILKYH